MLARKGMRDTDLVPSAKVFVQVKFVYSGWWCSKQCIQ